MENEVTRPAHRATKHNTSTKVYTVAQESRYLLVARVPALGLLKELLAAFSKFGDIIEHRLLDEHTLSSRFEDVYWLKFDDIKKARIAKRKMDNYSFMGSPLEVSYAPEYESVAETRLKLLERKREVETIIARVDPLPSQTPPAQPLYYPAPYVMMHYPYAFQSHPHPLTTNPAGNTQPAAPSAEAQPQMQPYDAYQYQQMMAMQQQQYAYYYNFYYGNQGGTGPVLSVEGQQQAATVGLDEGNNGNAGELSSTTTTTSVTTDTAEKQSMVEQKQQALRVNEGWLPITADIPPPPPRPKYTEGQEDAASTLNVPLTAENTRALTNDAPLQFIVATTSTSPTPSIAGNEQSLAPLLQAPQPVGVVAYPPIVPIAENMLPRHMIPRGEIYQPTLPMTNEELGKRGSELVELGAEEIRAKLRKIEESLQEVRPTSAPLLARDFPISLTVEHPSSIGQRHLFH